VHRSAVAVSEDRLLIETDSPDLTPDGAPSEINEPANCVLGLNKLAGLRSLSPERMAKITYENACRIFL
jgi:TatD DNase family protein